ncbi:hypothetical protein cyc_02026 [Cyclospora cayetanensis]|uniref:Uncharacterized protein n=1 Tax=Cyclospora cayetanensis TaxID=88456 RepID=A0A1D3CWB0_9EIME|nr:hypothetical protein cyc_02026 [Cyclospora cayetanensis]
MMRRLASRCLHLWILCSWLGTFHGVVTLPSKGVWNKPQDSQNLVETEEVETASEGFSLSGVSGGPQINFWEKKPTSGCMLTSSLGQKFGPFPALLTLNSAMQVVAFEPVYVEDLCTLNPNSSAPLHVVCPKGGSAQAGGAQRTGDNAVSRPVPDLTYRLSLAEIPIEGILPSLVATSIKTFVAKKAMKGTNQVASLFKWLTAQKKENASYTLTCEDGSITQANPEFSYTSFWGDLLLAAYELNDFQRSTIPKFSKEQAP